MRGKVRFYGLFIRHAWITPAHAGKRNEVSVDEIELKDHPRTCGEKIYKISTFASFCGSPPHMRGKAFDSKVTNSLSRITPAHAGKSYDFDAWIAQIEDHPRTCGEKGRQLFFSRRSLGSPPHMRGKEMNLKNFFVCIGITPAHAGKSVENAITKAIERDHPRTCGEKKENR